jgi:hypothetical protein
MTMPRLLLAFGLLQLVTILSAAEADVIVYGATPGGFCAALAASREGTKVILLEPTKHVGGLSTGGLSHCDSNQMRREALTGLFEEWHRRIVQDYVDRGQPAPYDAMDKTPGVRWTFEPQVAMRVTHAMLKEAGVAIVTDCQLIAADMAGSKIVRLRTSQGSFAAKTYIDGTYEGDLMAAAGVSWTIGREGRAEYGESLAGKRYPKPRMAIEGFDAQGQPLPLVTGVDAGAEEAGDRHVMTYSFRLCFTRDPANFVPIPAPAKYDPAKFELARRALQAGVKGIGFDLYPLPGNKLDGNNSIHGQVSLGLVGGSNTWHLADPAERARLWEAHKQYTLEFLHFLRTDPAVPEKARSQYASLGFCKDEFAATGHFPPALYVRESRRLKGLYVLTQKDILEAPSKDDPIAVSSFPIDSHDCQRVALRDGGVVNEGTILPVRVPGSGVGYAYQVPYRAILPRAEQCGNLLVPVALGSTHVAMCSLRIEGAWMAIGQGAGVAAALAAQRGIKVQDLPYADLRARLLAQGQTLQLPPPPTTKAASPKAAEKPLATTPAGLILDDQTAELEGDWIHSTNFKPYVGKGYVHDEKRSDGKCRATFRFKVPKEDDYELSMAYSAHPTRTTKLPIALAGGGVEHRLTVDQTQPLPPGEAFRPLGHFKLRPGVVYTLTLSNEGTGGFVILDAFQLRPTGPSNPQPR